MRNTCCAPLGLRGNFDELCPLVAGSCMQEELDCSIDDNGRPLHPDARSALRNVLCLGKSVTLLDGVLVEGPHPRWRR